MKTLRQSHTSSASSSSNPLSSSPSTVSSPWIHLRSLLIIASLSPVHDRVKLKSPWSLRRRKHALSFRKWISLFSPDGKLLDKVKFLKRVRSGGIEPRLRAKVWPFLLGVYDLTSTEAERDAIKRQRRKEYTTLRHHCQQLLQHGANGCKYFGKMTEGNVMKSSSFSDASESSGSEDVYSSGHSLSLERGSPDTISRLQHAQHSLIEEGSMEEISSDPFVSQSILVDVEESGKQVDFVASDPCLGCVEEHGSITYFGSSVADADSSDYESSVDEPESLLTRSLTEKNSNSPFHVKMDLQIEESFKSDRVEDYTTWQRIIRLDAIRANAEWVYCTSIHTSVSEEQAYDRAKIVGLKNYDHLEPHMLYHAARLVAVLEAYAIYDPEIGYCQGMSDLLSPIVAVIEDESEAFWCFVAFMRKARNNFKLDEVGIRRQLNIVSKIIRYKDSHLYRHLEKLQAEDCFFVYRMVVVLFRRELSFEQTLCLWEVMWADQAAIRAGIGKSAWGRITQRAPPTDDLLLYAIAACVLQKRKLIIEKYNSMDEILRECNDMAGQLDVWRLLDDAHGLVVTLHDKI